MSIPATDSAIEVAYWLIQRAEKDGAFLEDEKLHHLLFAAQVAYAQKFDKAVLIPSLFIVDEKGFSEPNLLKMFSLGRPFMPPVKLDDKVTAFLETIWKKYAPMTLAAMSTLIKASTAYKQNYRNGEKHIIEVNSILDSFKTSSTAPTNNRRKMLISQNGPVMVSKWTPRKIENSIRKGINNV